MLRRSALGGPPSSPLRPVFSKDVAHPTLRAGRCTERRPRAQGRCTSRKAGEAIPRVDFRPRVLVATNHHQRFMPRDGRRIEVARSRRGSDRVRAEAAFPAAAPAAAARYACQRRAGRRDPDGRALHQSEMGTKIASSIRGVSIPASFKRLAGTHDATARDWILEERAHARRSENQPLFMV